MKKAFQDAAAAAVAALAIAGVECNTTDVNAAMKEILAEYTIVVDLVTCLSALIAVNNDALK